MTHQISCLFCVNVAIFTLLCIRPTASHAQPELNYLAYLAALRTELIDPNPAGAKELSDALEACEKHKILQVKGKKKAAPPNIEQIKRMRPDMDRREAAIKANRDLYDLVSYGLLEHRYPFTIKADQPNLERIGKLNIQSNQKILVVMATPRVGTFFIHSMYPQVDVYEDDLGLRYELQHGATLATDPFTQPDSLSRVHPGMWLDRQLTVDQIILSPDYWKMAANTAFCQKMKAALKPGGRLVLVDDQFFLNCPDPSPQQTIKPMQKRLKKAGFMLLQETNIHGHVYSIYER